jgi:glycosyltransferase involved in cell wall biosynthesis
MKILMIACSYPPDPFVGSFRADKVARAMRDAGHEVDVITARLPDERAALRVDEPGLRVHTVRERAGPLSLYRHLAQRLRRNGSGQNTGPAQPVSFTAPGTSDVGAAGTRKVPRWKRYLLSAVWMPDDRQGFIPAALRRARPLMQNGIDLIYTTAPPFSDHLVGLILKRRSEVPWAAEFRDPWIENANRHAYLRSRGMDAVNRFLERRCVSRADRLVAVSQGTADLLRAKLPARERHKVLLAMNGIDNLMPEHEVRAGSGAVRVAHIGNCYGSRDPRQFLRAFAAVAHRRQFTATEVQVEFIGNCRSYRGESLQQMVAELGISDIVRFADWMPQSEARARARAADLFLLPFPQERGIIPNKLFDYLGLRKPILAFVHPEGEVAHMLRQLNGHFLVTDQSQDTAERMIEIALATARCTVVGTRGQTLLDDWTTHSQMRQLLSQLGLAGTTP